MMLTKKLLIQWNALIAGISFYERNKLFDNCIKKENSYGDWWKWKYYENRNKIKQENSTGFGGKWK